MSSRPGLIDFCIQVDSTANQSLLVIYSHKMDMLYGKEHMVYTCYSIFHIVHDP